MNDLIKQLGTMTVAELLELTRTLEDEWGVKAVDAIAPMPPTPPVDPEPKRGNDVELVSFGDSKIKVIKELRGLLGLGLREAKALVERAPVILWRDLEPLEAEEKADALQAAGAIIDVS